MGFWMIVNLISVLDDFSMLQFVSRVLWGYELCLKKVNGRSKTLWDSMMVYRAIRVWYPKLLGYFETQVYDTISGVLNNYCSSGNPSTDCSDGDCPRMWIVWRESALLLQWVLGVVMLSLGGWVPLSMMDHGAWVQWAQYGDGLMMRLWGGKRVEGSRWE